MATLNTTLSLTSTDVSSSALGLSVSASLGVSTPNIGMSRIVAGCGSPTSLVPLTSGTKYCYIKHLGKKADGTSASVNTINLSTLSSAPTRQSTAITVNASIVNGKVFNFVVDGVTLATITAAVNEDTTAQAICDALLLQSSIYSATFATVSSVIVITVTSSTLGDDMVITGTTDNASGLTIVATAATGSSFAMLRPGEFVFLPVKSGEGLSAVSGGNITANAVMVEYAYWTKGNEGVSGY